MIYIPDRIRIGYCNRKDTYTGRLAYVIYYDEYSKLRKETSWRNWRDSKIAPDEYENVPTEGFVLNKKVGGYSGHFDARQTYVRVYDPRGFEFEITVPNLLYILEHSNSLRGKGLEAQFVYGWENTELVLVPVDSEEYRQRDAIKQKLFPKENEYIVPSRLKAGFRYKTRYDDIVYMGKFDYYYYNGEKANGKRYFFFVPQKTCSGKLYWRMETRCTFSKYVIEQVNDAPVDEYADLLDKLEHDINYSPIDFSKDTFVALSFEEFEKDLNATVYPRRFYTTDPYLNSAVIVKQVGSPVLYKVAYPNRINRFENETLCSDLTITELFEYLRPLKKKVYLKNGNLYKEERFIA